MKFDPFFAIEKNEARKNKQQLHIPVNVTPKILPPVAFRTFLKFGILNRLRLARKRAFQHRNEKSAESLSTFL
jgi:hypothetical protein